MILKNPAELIPYVLEADRGEETPVTFWFKPFTAQDSYKYMSDVKTRVFRKDEAIEVTNQHEVHAKLFAQKIVKITNVSGYPDAVNGEVATDLAKFESWMSPLDVQEVVDAIQNERGLTEDESKK